MNSSTVYTKSIAASGTDNIVYAVPAQTRVHEFAVITNYAAIAATSGIQVVTQISSNGGSSYVSSGLPAQISLPIAATQLGQGSVVVRLGQYVGNVTHIKLLLTNLDATNASVVSIQADSTH